MHEQRSKTLEKIFAEKGPAAETEKSFTSERQPSAQSFSLHLDFRDGRASEGVAWSQFGRYRWADLGEHERLRIVFGPMCAIEILGHNLGALVAEIREGQLNGIREMVTGQMRLALSEGDSTPIILSVKAYPDFDQLFEAIQEEGKEAHETRHARRIER